jgi:hypothetical protein
MTKRGYTLRSTDHDISWCLSPAKILPAPRVQRSDVADLAERASSIVTTFTWSASSS